MSSQFRTGGSTRGNRHSRSRRGNRSFKSNPSSRASGSSKSQASTQSSQKSHLEDRLHEEYNPPFRLNASWSADEFYKLKIPHPFFEGNTETVQFPVLKASVSLSSRAIFYQTILDIQEQVNFDGENGPMLYYTFMRCVQGEALSEWRDIASLRADDAARSPENFAIGFQCVGIAARKIAFNLVSLSLLVSSFAPGMSVI